MSDTKLDKQAYLEIRKIVTVKAPPAITPEVDRKFLNRLLTNRRDLSEDELAELSAAIHPVVRDDYGRFFYVEWGHPRDVAFNEDPVFIVRADGLNGIVFHSTIYTLHFAGSPERFQASVAEVLAMIPLHLLHKVRAFETIGPHSPADFTRQSAAINAGYHVAVTHLFTKP